MKHILTLLCFFFSVLLLSAQNRNPALDIKRANVWHFGFESVSFAQDAPSLHFDSDTPVIMNNGQMVIDGCSSISDSVGVLQIYGGDYHLYNRLHTWLLNDSTHCTGNCGATSIQNTLTIPKPNDPNILYYFTVPVSLRYNVIDMSLDNGKGEFLEREVVLYPSIGAKIGAIHHCNGTDIWVVVHEMNNNNFRAYLITANGIDTTPIISQVGPIDNEPGTVLQGGLIKFSPNGKKMAITFDGFITPPQLLDFDNSTGVISNPVPLPKDTGDFGVAFSPDNSKLYIGTRNGRLLQYNLQAGTPADIAFSRKVIHNYPANGFGVMQNAIDGKIYVGKGGFPGNDYIAVINYPNILDTACSFVRNAIYLNSSFCSGGLANFPSSYFYTGSSAFPCYGDTTSTRIQVNDELLEANASPNPFEDYTQIHIMSDEILSNTTEFHLYDALGRECTAKIKVLSWRSNEIKAVLYKGNLVSGIYYLQVKDFNKTVSLKLIIS